MNDERREHINQRAQKSFKQDHERQKAVYENGIWKKAPDKRSDDRNNRRQSSAQDDNNLLCACTGLACEGVCREMHLHRPRFANPTAKKDAGVQKSWAEKCPEAYKN